MARNTEYELKLKIGGNLDKSFNNSINDAKKGINGITFKSAKKGVDAFEKGASAAFKTITAGALAVSGAITGIVVPVAKIGMEFESAFTGVRKTIDATEREYTELEKGIISMSKNLPSTAAEIAEVAEAAGQLGIEKESILDFSRVMIDLGESTNLSATEAASLLAKFANITDMDTDDYTRLGSTIVALGNNFATTEADIVSMSTGLASSGSLVGLAEHQILALSTAMSSVGIEQASGASTMSRLLREIQLATELGGKKLKKFASVAGMTGKQYQKAFEENAVGALSSFVDGLNDVERNGKSAIAILNDMGIKEVRLSNTILALANANGVMSDAVDIAGQAWEENSALAIEAGKRYRTMESQLSMLKNEVTAIGTDMYDNIKGPMRDGIGIVKEFVAELGTDISRSNVFSNIANSVQENLPQITAKIGDYANIAKGYIDLLIPIGGWFIKNSDIVVSGIVGIGTAFAGAKIAKGIAGVVTALAGSGLAGLAIAGIGVVATGLIGLYTHSKLVSEELKRQNLAAHFGDISLSIEEVQRVAKKILGEDLISNIEELKSSRKIVGDLSGSISESIRDINKQHWKIGIGVELTEDEKQAYQNNIASFISDTQELLIEDRYVMNLSLDLLTEGTDNERLKGTFNDFYQTQQDELGTLGKQLQEAVNAAYEDGLLSVDEAKVIAELQAQMASITEKIARSEFEAGIDFLGMKYGLENLDAESFKKLQDETNYLVGEAVVGHDKSAKALLGRLGDMRRDGSISDAQYKEEHEVISSGYQLKVADTQVTGLDAQLGGLLKSYETELSTKMPALNDKFQDAFETQMLFFDPSSSTAMYLWDGIPRLIKESVAAMDLDGETIANLGDMFGDMKPLIEEARNTRDAFIEQGKEVPEELTDLLNTADLLGAIIGDTDAITSLMASTLANNNEFREKVEEFARYGGFIPEGVAREMKAKLYMLDDAVDNLYSDAQLTFDRYFSKPFNVQLTYSVSSSRGKLLPDNQIVNKGMKSYLNSSFVPGYAKGGIIKNPTLATFAEEGPEAAIPLDGSPNAIGLWKQAGQILGVLNNSDNTKVGSMYNKMEGIAVPNNTTITYSPQIVVQGNASRADMDGAVQNGYAQFVDYMDKWKHGQARTSF